MEWFTNHPECPSLVHVDSSVYQAEGSPCLKAMLNSAKEDRKMDYHPSQLDSPVSLKDEEEEFQQWQFSVHQNLESQMKTLLDKVSMTNVKGYTHNYKWSEQIENIEHQQQNPCSPDGLPKRLASPWTKEDYCLSDERLHFLLDDPRLLQELMLEENRRSSSYEINLENNSNGDHPAVQVVEFCRLCRLYDSIFSPIRIRLSYSDTTPVILVMNWKDVYKFTCQSTEITDIRDTPHCAEIPFIISEMLNFDEALNRPRYILLLYNEDYECWELVGCLDSFNSATTVETPFEHPSDVVFVSVEDEKILDIVSLLSNDHDTDVEDCTQTVERDLQSVDEFTAVAVRQLFIDNSRENDTMLLQDRLEHQIYSCPTFIFPSLIAMMSSSISSPLTTIDEDEPTPKEPEILQDKMFKCETCEKEFRLKYSLKVHEVIHNPAKWKQCCYCDFKTPRSVTLKNHVARFHWCASQKISD